MGRGVQFVHQLKEKITRLIKWAKNNGFELNSMRAVERATQIDRTTLYANMESYRISRANQMRLAKGFGFDLEWPEWRDPSDTKRSGRRDTADAFIARFIEEKSNSGPLTIKPGRVRKRIDPRFANFRCVVPASYAPGTMSAAIPLCLLLSFDRRGWSVVLDEGRSILTVGVKQVDLQLIHDCEDADIEVFALAPVNGGENNFVGDVEGLSPWWVIKVAGGDLPYLAGKRALSDRRDCLCHGFQAGDRIEAVMTVRVTDCSVDVEGDLLDGVHEMKVALIKQLTKLSVIRDAEAVLCQQTLTVVRM
jgi:hypothetical protein